jgi:hypothetical protein
MPRTTSLGVAGLTLLEGDHVCAFYRGIAERDELLIPYLRDGLASGDRCVCVVDACDPETVLARLGSVIDVAAPLAGRQLDVLSSRDTYLLGGGFSTDRMLDFWRTQVAAAIDDGGYHFARSVGEMTWALRDAPGVEALLGYESRLNRFLPEYPQVILCLYDLEAFSGDVIVDILKTHPKVLVGGSLIENPYYVEPDEYLAARV